MTILFEFTFLKTVWISFQTLIWISLRVFKDFFSLITLIEKVQVNLKTNCDMD